MGDSISSLPLYYPGKSLGDMEGMLRRGYLKSSGWLESAESKLATRYGQPIPWFTYAALAFLERELTSNVSLFEYGGGQSTLFWASHVKRVAAIDHDPAFVSHLQPKLPQNVQLQLVEEGRSATQDVEGLPDLVDPVRDEKTYRSGQLNRPFQDYALKLLEHSQDEFDVVIIDGMARVLSTWAALRHFRRGGFIVFDNSDRECYQPAYEMLDQAGYRRIDFWGLGPINPYQWCTSVFYQPQRFSGARWFASPARHRSAKPALEAKSQSREFGILVLGFNRPYHLQAVLESLRLQGRLHKVHVWLDGTQGRGEYKGQNDLSLQIAQRYAVRELRAQRSHLGIEKMMLDALDDMSRRYEQVIVLEDDCFPLEDGISQFEEALEVIKGRDNIFSVYGHHFGMEAEGKPDFPRFQGWGWAAHSEQIRRYLPRLRELFMMNEQTYLEHIEERLSQAVKARLDVTPGRDVLGVLQSFFSWDSATAFLTALDGVGHRRTPRQAVVNTGITKGIGHFHEDSERLRKPPFNMIPLEEAWDRFDTTTQPCRGEKYSYGLDELDRLIADAASAQRGFFVELGAFDGVTQSNSVLLEKLGWRGLLIEANPGSYAKCVKSRPDAEVVHAACVGRDFTQSTVTITDVGLMSMTAQADLAAEQRDAWLARGEGFAGRERQDIDVPAETLSAILERYGVSDVDLLILDVEGAEIDVLTGLDFERHAPRWIVAEDAYNDSVKAYLSAEGYRMEKILLERKFTRDCLYLRAK